MVLADEGLAEVDRVAGVAGRARAAAADDTADRALPVLRRVVQVVAVDALRADHVQVRADRAEQDVRVPRAGGQQQVHLPLAVAGLVVLELHRLAGLERVDADVLDVRLHARRPAAVGQGEDPALGDQELAGQAGPGIKVRARRAGNRLQVLVPVLRDLVEVLEAEPVGQRVDERPVRREGEVDRRTWGLAAERLAAEQLAGERVEREQADRQVIGDLDDGEVLGRDEAVGHGVGEARLPGDLAVGQVELTRRGRWWW